jgi:hypothetical protein
MVGLIRLDMLEEALRRTMLPSDISAGSGGSGGGAQPQRVAGDYVELGVWRGGASVFAKAFMEAYGISAHVHLVDSFQVRSFFFCRYPCSCTL